MIWIQYPRLQKKLLGSKVWIQDPRSKITEKTSWIQGLDPRSKNLGKTSWIQSLDPRSKIQDSRKNFLDPGSGSKKFFLESWILDLGSRPWIQKFFLESWILDPDLGSKKFFLESWILDLGSRPWIQEVFPRILDLGSWIQISCYGFIAFINVCKHHLKNHSKNAPKKRSPNMPKTLYIPVKKAITLLRVIPTMTCWVEVVR